MTQAHQEKMYQTKAEVDLAMSMKEQGPTNYTSGYLQTATGSWPYGTCPTCGKCPTCGRGGYQGPTYTWPGGPYYNTQVSSIQTRM